MKQAMKASVGAIIKAVNTGVEWAETLQAGFKAEASNRAVVPLGIGRHQGGYRKGCLIFRLRKTY